MNLAQLRNLVIENTGRTDKESLINSAINLALTEISSRRNWLDLQTEGQVTLLVGQDNIDLGSEAQRVTEIRVLDDDNSHRIRIRPKEWLVSRFPNPAQYSAGRPSWGWLEGSRLFVLPIADANYSVVYTSYILHPELTEDSDVVVIRAGVDRAIIAYATYWVFLSIEKHEDAKVWFASFESMLRTVKDVDRKNSVIIHEGTPRGSDEPAVHAEYWLDPFVKEMP